MCNWFCNAACCASVSELCSGENVRSTVTSNWRRLQKKPAKKRKKRTGRIVEKYPNFSLCRNRPEISNKQDETRGHSSRSISRFQAHLKMWLMNWITTARLLQTHKCRPLNGAQKRNKSQHALYPDQTKYKHEVYLFVPTFWNVNCWILPQPKDIRLRLCGRAPKLNAAFC